MKNNNECINVSPPLFISNVWINGVFKDNINVKLKKKIKP